MSFSNILSERGFNLGGVSSFKVAPIEWITNLPPEEYDNESINYELIFISGKGWITVTPEHESTEVLFNAKSARGGTFSEMKLEATVNKTTIESFTSLRAAGFHRHALLVTDNNGQTILVGKRYHGCNLMFDVAINPLAEGKTFFKVTLTFETEFAPFFYIPE